jgi:hypothetical protein
MIKSDEKMTTESDSKGQEITKELRSEGIPARIPMFSIDLLNVFSDFSVFSTTLRKMSHVSSGT